MARLQILQLPEGASDDRPPWLLIVDELPTRDAQLDMLRRDLADNDLTARIGARGALCFESTVTIPANEPVPLADTSDPERAGVTQIVYAHERTRLDLCSALRLDTGTPWRKLIETVSERQQELAGLRRDRDIQAEAIERVRRTSTEPEVMDSQQEHPTVWMHGYHCGVLAARDGLRPRNEPTVKP